MLQTRFKTNAVALDTKTREFQYKFLNRCLVTNTFLCRIGIIPSPACSLCGESDESLEHLFLSCHYTKNFWSEVIKWLVDDKVKIENLSDKDILFGIIGCEEEICESYFITGKTIERFSYDLEMKTREQNRNNKRTEIERFDWFIERTDKRAWLLIG